MVTRMLPVVVVHGGAGHIPQERSEGAKEGACAAARAGYEVLRGGGGSVEAVVQAVTLLEDNPLYNAGDATPRHALGEEEGQVSQTDILNPPASGCGSVLNVEGDVEMDALLMDGQTLASGAVAAVRNIANPIQLARLVMDRVGAAGSDGALV